MHQQIFDLPLFDLLNKTTQTHVYNDHQFFESRDAVLEIIKQPGARIVVHNRYFGPLKDTELEVLKRIVAYYKINSIDSKLIFISSFDIPILKNVSNIHFFYFPEYHAYYYPLYKDFKIEDSKLIKKFLSLNKRGSEHRQLLYRAFYHHNWLKDSYFSYLCETGPCGRLFDEETHNFFEHVLKFWEATCPKIAQWSRPEKNFITTHDHDALKSYQEWASYESSQVDPTWLHSTDLYKQSFCSVIVETSPGNKFINLSEKTIRALCLGHPIIFIATPGTVKFLRTLNFDMFDDLIDHSYDNVIDHQQRMMQSLESVKKINNYSVEELSAINQSLISRRQHNIDIMHKLYNAIPQRSIEILEDITNLIPVQSNDWILSFVRFRASVKN